MVEAAVTVPSCRTGPRGCLPEPVPASHPLEKDRRPSLGPKAHLGVHAGEKEGVREMMEDTSPVPRNTILLAKR
ncbi:hypothetical protein SKB0092_08090 [Roseomonas mucosa]